MSKLKHFTISIYHLMVFMMLMHLINLAVEYDKNLSGAGLLLMVLIASCAAVAFLGHMSMLFIVEMDKTKTMEELREHY